MIRRVFINNFRCLVAFEKHFDEMSVYWGPNGSGKSSLFDAILFLRDLAVGNCFLGGAGDESKRTVSSLEFCRWLSSNTQEFEIEMEINGSTFFYHIQIQQVADYEQPRIVKEIARCDGRDLYTRELNKVQFGENKDKEFSLDWRLSALTVFQPSRNEKQLNDLKNALNDIVILRPSACAFEFESKYEAKHANMDLKNIVSWYRYLAQDQDFTDVLRESLQRVWPDDFKSLKLTEAGVSVKQLQLNFNGLLLPFEKLSDGEKMLVALYMIHAVFASTEHGMTVLIDEPDNHISLQEMQPWLVEMSEIVDDKRQLKIITHDAEIIKCMPSHSKVFFRDNHSSPTRVKSLEIPEGISVSDALARGWV